MDNGADFTCAVFDLLAGCLVTLPKIPELELRAKR
jgi:hypothetical protein